MSFSYTTTYHQSLGGVVGSCASQGFGFKQRASERKKGGILEIIYLSAFALPKGKSLLDMLGGQPLPWMRIEVRRRVLGPNYSI